MRGPSRILSEAQVEEMIELRERGRSLSAIAAHFVAAGTHISESAIGWQCMIAGADLPPGRRRPLQRGRPSMRNGFPIRPFTPEEDARLIEMDRRGAGLSEMATALSRRTNSIRGRLLTLARHEARAEDMEVA